MININFHFNKFNISDEEFNEKEQRKVIVTNAVCELYNKWFMRLDEIFDELLNTEKKMSFALDSTLVIYFWWL